MNNLWISSAMQSMATTYAASTCSGVHYYFTPQPVLTAKVWLPAGHLPSWKRGIWA